MFVCEKISAEDRLKYDWDNVEAKQCPTGFCSRDWMIDRQNDIHLRKIGDDRDEWHHCSTWLMFWKGNFFRIYLCMVGGGGGIGQPGWCKWKLESWTLPEHLGSQKALIAEAIKSALTVYKDAGTYSLNTDFNAELDASNVLR